MAERRGHGLVEALADVVDRLLDYNEDANGSLGAESDAWIDLIELAATVYPKWEKSLARGERVVVLSEREILQLLSPTDLLAYGDQREILKDRSADRSAHAKLRGALDTEEAEPRANNATCSCGWLMGSATIGQGVRIDTDPNCPVHGPRTQAGRGGEG